MSDNSFKSWRKEVCKATWLLFKKKNVFMKFILPAIFGGGTFVCTFFEGVLEKTCIKNEKLWSVILSLFIFFICLIIEYLLHYRNCKRNKLKKLLEKKASLMQDNTSLRNQKNALSNEIKLLKLELSDALKVNRDNELMEIIKDTENEVFPLSKDDDDRKIKEKLQKICDGVRNIIIKMKGEEANDCCVSIKQLSTLKKAPILLQTVRDSATPKSRDDSQEYKDKIHYLSDNTPYKYICEHYKDYVEDEEIRWNEADFHYLNNSISSDPSFEITRKKIAQKKKNKKNGKAEPLPYDSLYVCPSLPLVNNDRKAKISGFICIDHPKSNFFCEEKIQYLNNKMERFADMAYSVIKSMPKPSPQK